MVTGSEPFHYQWQFNGTDIAGATDSALTLTDVQMINAGNYQVVVTNDYGATNSSTAILTVARLIEWGFPRPIPLTLTNATAVSGGILHSLALNPDGTATAWGDNPNGQTSVPGGLSNVVAIASGFFHNLALKSDGTVVAWGAGTNVTGEPNYGQSRVPAGLNDVAKIAAGGLHSLVLNIDGTVLAWGYNASGQTNVPAGLSNVVAIAGGGFHSLALKNDGTVVAWGAGAVTNIPGRVNLGQSKVPANLSNVVSVAAGGFHSLALKDNGTVVAWGDNFYGQTDVPAGLSNVVDIVAGGYHNLALRRDGTAITWGFNALGRLRIPVGVVNIVALGAGAEHSLAIMNDGTPFILRQSPDWTIYSGMTVSFTVAAVGASVLNYQWQFNETNIDGATNAVLVLTNVALIGDGRYRCLVSNALGTGISSPIALTVLRSRPRIGTSSSDLQLTSAGFSLQVDGLSGDGNIILLFSTNLVDWQPVLTNPPLTGSLKMMYTGATNFPVGFYEVLEE